MREMLDFLYCLGCEYSIKDDDMKTLCTQLGVDFNQLQNHSPKGKPAPVTLAI
jgi:hypothetical protein